MRATALKHLLRELKWADKLSATQKQLKEERNKLQEARNKLQEERTMLEQERAKRKAVEEELAREQRWRHSLYLTEYVHKDTLEREQRKCARLTEQLDQECKLRREEEPDAVHNERIAVKASKCMAAAMSTLESLERDGNSYRSATKKAVNQVSRVPCMAPMHVRTHSTI